MNRNKYSNNKGHLYSKSQVIWGIIGRVFYFGTTFYLNVQGLTNTPEWFSKHDRQEIASPLPLNTPGQTLNSIKADINRGLVYGNGQTLYKYVLEDESSFPVATMSGMFIQDLVVNNSGNLVVMAGSSSQTYDIILKYQKGVFVGQSLPAISSVTVKPILSRDGNYIYWWMNDGNGRKILIKTDLNSSSQQEIVQSSLPIHRMAISPDGNFIAMIVEMGGGNQARTYVLGIAGTASKNLNLFLSVEIDPDASLLFSNQGNILFTNSQKGILAFSILNGKLVDSKVGLKLLGIGADGIIWGLRSSGIAEVCKKGLVQLSGYNEVVKFTFSENGFGDTGTTALTELLKNSDIRINSAILFNNSDHYLLLKGFHADSCQAQLNIYDKQSGTLAPVMVENIEKLPVAIVP